VLEGLFPLLKRWRLPHEQLPKITQNPTRKQLIDEINALGIPGLPHISNLKLMKGDLVNFSYSIHGNSVRILDDNATYWSLQEENQLREERYYGIVADDNYLIIIEYGRKFKDPRLVLIKRRA
jgi:hypothetical protein